MFGAPLDWLNHRGKQMIDAQGQIIETYFNAANATTPAARAAAKAKAITDADDANAKAKTATDANTQAQAALNVANARVRDAVSALNDANAKAKAATDASKSASPGAASRAAAAAATTANTVARNAKSAADRAGRDAATAKKTADTAARSMVTATAAASATAVALAIFLPSLAKDRDNPNFCTFKKDGGDYIKDMLVLDDPVLEEAYYGIGAVAPNVWGARHIVQQEDMPNEQLYQACKTKCDSDSKCFGFVALKHTHDIRSPTEYDGGIIPTKYPDCTGGTNSCLPQCILSRTPLTADSFEVLNNINRSVEPLPNIAHDFERAVSGSARAFIHARSFGVTTEELNDKCAKR